MLRFDVLLHGRPAECVAGPAWVCGGRAFATLLPADGRAFLPLRATFDAALANLAALPRLYTEPDGSFAWTGPPSAERSDRPSWRLEGEVHDHGPAVGHVELRGACPEARFLELLAALGETPDGVLAQPRRAGVLLAVGEFLRCAAEAE